MRSLIITISAFMLITGLLLSPALADTGVKPPNATVATLPDYNLTIGIWAAPGGLDSAGLSIYEMQNGVWNRVPESYVDLGSPLQDALDAYGSEKALIQDHLYAMNIRLASRYPAIVGGNPITKINNALGTYFKLDTVNGVTVLESK